ncbi:LV151 protein, partial [Chloroceryle aenea]|nr:LV151 protein [Chloroceryle aenea]
RLLLLLLALAAAWSYGQAQEVLKQSKLSVTQGKTKIAWIECKGEGLSNIQSEYIHWYRQLPDKAPERILYIQSRQVYYDDNSYKNKYTASRKGTNIFILRVFDINSGDEGTYYCACWKY